MKKSLLIIGLFSLMMVLTSFTAPNETGGEKQGDRGTVGTGNFDTGGEKQGDRGTVGTGNYDTGGEKQGDRGTVGTGN